MESSSLQELEQIPGVGIVLTVEFSRSLAGKNLYNNLLQSHSREFFTLKGIKLLPAICPISASILLTTLRAAKPISFMIDSASLRPFQSIDVCSTYSAAQFTTLRIPSTTPNC